MSAVTLTPKGTHTAEDTWGHGPRYAILAYLYGEGAPVEVDNVINHLDTDPIKVQALLRTMINDDLIEEV